GSLLAWQAGAPAAAALAAVLRRAQAGLDATFRPAAALHLAGTLNRDPAHQASDRAKASFPVIFDLAVCARTAAEPLRDRCVDKAKSALLAWARVYRPSGNPIDERFFAPMLQAADLLVPVLPSAPARRLLAWVRAFATAGDAFYASRPPADTARSNNWMAARLLVRALAATVCDDRALQAGTRDLLDAFAARNFVPDAGGRIDGETFDFMQRDALEYHVTDLWFLTQIALFAPAIVAPHARALILDGLRFLKPFYLGERRHVEFVHTTVAFDIKRRDEDTNNPAFQNQPWDPAQARPLLRLARLVFPEVRAWTGDVVDAGYDERISLLAAAFGEPAP
ncbi:MAG: alginate lyase family protein, partial [Acetobacteraceae bacterium]